FHLGKVNLVWSLINEGKYVEIEAILNSMKGKGKKNQILLLRAFSSLYQNDRAEFNRFRNKAVQAGIEEKKGILNYLVQLRDESKKARATRERLPVLDLDFGRFYEKIGDFKKAKDFYLRSKKREGIIRLISLLKYTKGSKTEIEEYKNSLIDWTGVIPPDLNRVLYSNVVGPYPEGVLTFIYPEDLVEIPAGPFKIGKKGASRSDKNHFWRHDVFTGRFLIGKYEVSNLEYLLFTSSTGFPSPYNTHNSSYDLWKGGNFKTSISYQPVVNVSWYDVNLYLDWKSQLSGETYKLPTEERWEKAARGLDERRYPWGNEEPAPALANYGKNWNDSGKKYTTIQNVDSFEKGKSPFNLFNMAGNVWEWTSSTHKSFFYDDPSLEIEKSHITKNELKVIRGGSWINKPDALVSTWRNRNWPYVKYNGIGFRVVKDP
ncbi:MAG: formylglycine-generating enzyme family protein, partial [Nitrospinota bacterium]